MLSPRYTARLAAWLTSALAVFGTRLREERGDVPGWVMITLMTAAVAMILWGLARDTFTDLFQNAFDTVGPSDG